MPFPVIAVIGLGVAVVTGLAEASDRAADREERDRLKGDPAEIRAVLTALGRQTEKDPGFPLSMRQMLTNELVPWAERTPGSLSILYSVMIQTFEGGHGGEGNGVDHSALTEPFGLLLASTGSKLRDLPSTARPFQDAFFGAVVRALAAASESLGGRPNASAAILGDIERAAFLLDVEYPVGPPPSVLAFAEKHGLREDAVALAVSGARARPIPNPAAFDPVTGELPSAYGTGEVSFFSTAVQRSFTRDVLPYAGFATGSARSFLSLAGSPSGPRAALDREAPPVLFDAAEPPESDAAKVALVGALGLAAAAGVWFFVGEP